MQINNKQQNLGFGALFIQIRPQKGQVPTPQALQVLQNEYDVALESLKVAKVLTGPENSFYGGGGRGHFALRFDGPKAVEEALCKHFKTNNMFRYHKPSLVIQNGKAQLENYIAEWRLRAVVVNDKIEERWKKWQGIVLHKTFPKMY